MVIGCSLRPARPRGTERLHTVWMGHSELDGDLGAHGGTDKVRGLHFQVIEQIEVVLSVGSESILNKC